MAELSVARTVRSCLVAVVVVAAAAVPARPQAPSEPDASAGAAVALWVLEGGASHPGELRRDVIGVGAEIVAYLGPDRWLVAAPRGATDTVASRRALRSWSPAEGIVPELRALAGGEAGPPIGLVLALAPGTDLAAVAAGLEAAGARATWARPGSSPLPQLGLRVAAADVAAVLDALEATPALAWADLQPAVRLRNAASVWRCQSGTPGSTPIHDRGLRGQGQVIAICDTGLDVDDCRFDDPVSGLPAINGPDGTEVDPDHRKVLAVDFHWFADWPPGDASWDDNGHGTHVAGSAAGDGLSNGAHDGSDGMAPAAKLVIQDGGALVDDCADLPGLGCPVKPLEPVLEQARDQGARIHTNSWGDEENIQPFGRYTERTADVDRFMWSTKDTLVVFAAGNAGPGTGSVGSPATAKNVLAVGATIHGDLEPTCVAPFSSRGWTRDGRIKPDVVVPGTQVVSAASDGLVPSPSCDDAVKSGTSMAAPTAAGLAALVRQYFTDGFHPSGSARPADAFEPSAALVKAVLVASALDLTTRGCRHEPIPSRDQGWGLVQLDTALAFAGDRRRLVVDDHRQGFGSAGQEPRRLEVVVPEAGPIKVVLAWTDAPSSSLATANLVNDLDLRVSGPGGTYLGNVFAAGVSLPGGAADRVNNVEVVWLPEAAPGLWTIEVAPHAVPAPAQDYALVVTGDVRQVEAPRRPSGRRIPE
ncbi:MAG TPA: S8 family serine peptidase [Methylomirabilota bacterium]|nr:S8 family serine peptidase [Methylomirabilota bacterium]